MTMHTPGDWTRNANQIYAAHTDEDGDHETLICDVFDEHDWWKANAALIIAAPRLLDELRRLVRDGEIEAAEAGEPDTPWLDGARAAIAITRLPKRDAATG